MDEVRQLWILPVVTATFCSIGIIVPYAIGAANGNIPAILPYISDGGAYPPEKSIFSFLQNVSALLIMLTAYVKHIQFVAYYELRRHDVFWRRLSLTATIIAWISAIGLMIVGNFSEMDALMMHNIGAAVTFLFALLYLGFTTGLSFIHPLLCSRSMAFTRVTITTVAVFFLVFHEITLYGSIFVPSGTNTTVINHNNQTEEMGGYKPEFIPRDSPFFTNHIVSTATEWALALVIFAYFATFAEEFRKSSLDLPAIHFDFSQSHQEETEEQAKLAKKDSETSINP